MESKLVFLMQVRESWHTTGIRLVNSVLVICLPQSRTDWFLHAFCCLPHKIYLAHALFVQGLSASRQEAISIIFKYPHVLNLSVDKNLRGKLDFFIRELCGTQKEVRDAIVGSPSLLGYSLTNRLNRRVGVLRSLGVKIIFTDHVWVISSYSGLRFNRWIEKIVMSEVGASSRGDKEVEGRMKIYRAMLRVN